MNHTLHFLQASGLVLWLAMRPGLQTLTLRGIILCRVRYAVTCVALWVMVSQTCAQFNVYHPFPASDAVWGLGTGCFDVDCGDWAYVQNYIAGDTLINGQNYKKIQENYVGMSTNGCCFPPGDDGPGFLREDTAERKVYWRNIQWGEESLLYDFTLDVGDTLQGFLFNCNPSITAVVSVDSILVGPNYRRRINFDTTETCSPFSIIEGIGSTTGITGCFYSPFAHIETKLRCFTVGNDVLYLAPCGPADLVPCGLLPNEVLDDASSGRLAIRISPNPVFDQMIVNVDEKILPVKISILDLTGKEIWREDITSMQVSIDVSWFAAGTYFIRSSDGGTASSFAKVIKQ